MEQSIGIIITVLIIGLVVFLLAKEWLSEWEGTLTDKKEVFEQDEEGYSQKKRKLLFETTDGKNKTSTVSRRAYKNAVVGDKYKKTKHSFKPKRV